MVGWGCHNWAVELKYSDWICGLVSWVAKGIFLKSLHGKQRVLET